MLSELKMFLRDARKRNYRAGFRNIERYCQGGFQGRNVLRFEFKPGFVSIYHSGPLIFFVLRESFCDDVLDNPEEFRNWMLDRIDSIFISGKSGLRAVEGPDLEWNMLIKDALNGLESEHNVARKCREQFVLEQ